MVGGRLLRLPCFFKHSAVLLLVVYFHDVEAATCEHLVHKKVGDTVELPSCLPSGRVTYANWNYQGLKIVDWDQSSGEQVKATQFAGRVNINTKNFSLTVKSLTLRDSGNFSFASDVNDTQTGMITITLQVHEPITEDPVPAVNSTWHASNSSCTVLVECNATRYSRVAYNWTVGNQTHDGSRGHFSLTPQEGDTNVTCTVYNAVGVKSAFKTVKCSNDTSLDSPVPGSVNFVISVAAASGIVCLVLVAIVAAGVYHWKQRQADTDSHGNTIYADISDNVTMKDVRSNTLTNPSSIYETIDDRVNSVTVTGPQTVYDQIQFNRPTEIPTSLYQDVYQGS
ncbi:SLAM family member 6 [Centroberyx affinis]|uniref:SLAM family member 6 n=1 Tax=Centroberyx affinis TaxID=166261 RepID=UPI003A5C6B2F